jgi:precorrin-8X/cobalt-precorrin-8 methylmutase
VSTPVHPIEVESYRIMASRVDLSNWPVGPREVVARLIHASADLEYAHATVIGDGAVRAAVEALRRGAPVITDVTMVAAGMSAVESVCLLPEVTVAEPGVTRSAAAMRLAAERHPEGALVVVGCAPTALFEALRLDWQPAAVIGLPVGFVGAAESKQALRESRFAPVAISNVGEKGGSAVAAAAVNALWRIAHA